MQRPCKCGHPMEMKLRTIVYSCKVEIENVPVFTCESCESTELHENIKLDLTEMIGKLGINPDKQSLRFEDANELANLLLMATSKEYKHMPLDQLVTERINQLLDTMLLASSLGDDAWVRDIRRRLGQMSDRQLAFDPRS